MKILTTNPDMPVNGESWTMGQGLLTYCQCSPVLSWYEWPLYAIYKLLRWTYPVKLWRIDAEWHPGENVWSKGSGEWVIESDGDDE